MISFTLKNLVRSFSKLPIMPYYAVRMGRQTGIYNTWNECKQQVDGVPARFKKFSTMEEAQNFMAVVNPRDAKRKPFNFKPKTKKTGNKRKNEEEYGGDGKRSKQAVQHDPERPVVYTDGCCFSNGRAGAKAGIGVYWGEGDSRNVSEKLQGKETNQRAELNAAIRALQTAHEANINKLEIKTDSMYTLNAVTKWMDGWQKNGFKTANGKDVKNKEDIVKLHNLCKKTDVKWTHVRGHHGYEGNEKADELAKRGAERK